MLYPFNYGNKCRIFGLFSLLGSGCHVYESNHLRDELSQLLYIDFSLFANSKILLCLTKWSALSCPLGGPRYIHLTKETNAVFPGFFDPLAPAAIIYNSITSVMNYLFFISSDFSDFASLSDPQTLPFFFKRVPPWFYLRRRVLYPTELQKHCLFYLQFQ